MNLAVPTQPEWIPLHDQVAAKIRSNILPKLQPGLKLAPERHLARQLGVSVLTLRQALSVLAHEGLIDRRRGSGTFAADARKQTAVAVCTATYPGQPSDSFQMRLFLVLSELFQRRGYRCRTYFAPVGLSRGWADLTDDLNHGRIAGAVFVGMNPASVPLPLQDNGVSSIGWHGGPGAVSLDYSDLLRRGVEHLVERGCRRIALMQWLGNTRARRSSCAAFARTLTRYGQSARREWVRALVPPDLPGAGWEQFRDLWSAHSEKPDGLLVSDDVLFRDVALAILDSRIQVPQQLQVVVHANKGSGIRYPFPVSRLEVDLQGWAEAMVARLIGLMNHEPVAPAVQLIAPRLVPAEAPRPQMATNQPAVAPA